MPPEVVRHPPMPEQARRRLAARLERCLPELRGVLGALLAQRGGRASRDAVDDLLGEVTQELLAKADAWDDSRSLVAWASGFAVRILAGRARRQRRGPQQVAASQLGAAGMERLLEGLAFPDSGGTPLREWLARLSSVDRRIIECRYFENRTGSELAQAIGAPSAGAARVRLARALARLRDIAMQEKGGEA